MIKEEFRKLDYLRFFYLSAGPFTVFAPTDEAIAKLPEGTVDGLLKDIPKLTAVLTYHVVDGKVPASDVVQHPKLTTIQGPRPKDRRNKMAHAQISKSQRRKHPQSRHRNRQRHNPRNRQSAVAKVEQNKNTLFFSNYFV